MIVNLWMSILYWKNKTPRKSQKTTN